MGIEKVETIQACAFDASELEEIGGCFESVTTVGNFAFSHCRIKAIKLPSLRDIGENAFQYSKLESFAFPLACYRIPAGCFLSCLFLRKVVMHSFIEEIGSEAFSQTAIETLQWPLLCKAIPARCFSLSQLSCIDGINDVAEIGEEAFAGCLNMKSFACPVRCNMVKSYTFKGCERLSSVQGLDKVMMIDKQAFFYTGFSSDHPLDLSHSSVQKIGVYAFGGLSSESVKQPYFVNDQEYKNAFIM